MTAWTTLSNALVAVGAKPFATTIQALRDNPIAIAEGALDAPKVVGAALDLMLPFVDTGIVASPVAGWTSGLDRATWIELDIVVVNGGATSPLQGRLSSDGGTTWSAYTTIFSVTGGSSLTGRLFINIKTGAARLAAPSIASATLAFTGAPNAVQFRINTASSSISLTGKIIGGVIP